MSEPPPAPTVTGKYYIRCMGGNSCYHAPGACTASPEYQAQIKPSPNAPQAEAVVTEAPLTFEGWLDEIENWSLRWERVCEELEIDTLRNGSRLRIWLKTAWDLGATAALRQHQSAVEALREDFKTSQLQLLDALVRASKAEDHIERLQEFIDEIHKRTPLGQWIEVKHHPNGDWSVAEQARDAQGWKERATKAEAENERLREALERICDQKHTRHAPRSDGRLSNVTHLDFQEIARKALRPARDAQG